MKKSNVWKWMAVCMAMVVSLCGCTPAMQAVNTTSGKGEDVVISESGETVLEETSQVTTESDSVVVDIEIAEYGTITVALDATAAPITVENFVALAESGFYDGLTFHRIIEGFMMQGGDPLGNGTGGSENRIKGEFTSNGVDNQLSHTRGAISMARSMDKNSASSQFFIVHQDSLYLDGEYAVFGYVTEGIEIVDKVCADAVPTDRNGTIPAEQQPVITSITVRENE